MKTPHVIFLTPSSRGLPEGLSPGQWRQLVKDAAGVWSHPKIACTSVRLEVSEPKLLSLAAQDGTNLVVFRNRTWCHNERCGRLDSFPLQAAAMTTVYPEGARGAAVVEGDIEVNGVSASYEEVPSVGSRAHAVSLKSVLIHEIGHILGLPDACGVTRRPSGTPKLLDCSTDDTQRVMFPLSGVPAPTRGDIELLCRERPSASGAGCSFCYGGASADSFLGLAILVGVIGLRRRTRRHCAAPTNSPIRSLAPASSLPSAMHRTW